jgi:hypothetical protein
MDPRRLDRTAPPRNLLTAAGDPPTTTTKKKKSSPPTRTTRAPGGVCVCAISKAMQAYLFG